LPSLFRRILAGFRKGRTGSAAAVRPPDRDRGKPPFGGPQTRGSAPKRGPLNAKDLATRLGYRFRDASHLERALTHRSSLAKNRHTSASNERLEFLGDSVLGFLMTEELYKRFPDGSEGTLTRVKSHIVSRDRLAEESLRIGLGDALILGAGEEQSGGRRRHSILADAYEALLGAIYLDGGVDAARRFVAGGLFKRIGKFVDYKQQQNYKSWLLEHVQSEGGRAPLYRVSAESGPDHAKVFTIDVVVRSQIVGSGNGNSKKRAEQAAAKNALERMGLL
jgi:ribonuclease III